MIAKRFENYIKFSMCDMLKIGIGSSSSHTLAPWLAANDAMGRLEEMKIPDDLKSIKVKLYASLGFGGRGHYTSVAVPLGFLKKDPQTFDISTQLGNALHIDKIDDIRDIGNLKQLEITVQDTSVIVDYEVYYDIIHEGEDPPEDPDRPENPELEKMTFLFRFTNAPEEKMNYYSYGGGSFGTTEEPEPLYEELDGLPLKYDSAEKLLKNLKGGQSISSAIYANEKTYAEYRKDHPGDYPGDLPQREEDIVPYLKTIADQMGTLIYNGCTYDKDDRCYDAMYANQKAKQILEDLLKKKGVIKQSIAGDFPTWQSFFKGIIGNLDSFHGGDITQLIGAFALAVSEQNAALKNVVTAPTNGACGIIPSVLYFYVTLFANERERKWLFDDEKSPQKNNIVNFLLVANTISGIIKNNFCISGGVGGCQAEVGTAAAMAGGALMEALELTDPKILKAEFPGGIPGYSSSKVFNAAAAALKHFLGSACDPVGGLVEIPCVERNLAASASAIALGYEMLGLGDDYQPVAPFDVVVAAANDISEHMSIEIKETSLGGLAAILEEDVKKARPDLFEEEERRTAVRSRRWTGC
ncbi:MAG: hypothetical protein GY757_58885 [bacterium]|nr:hypothetical protein [bacterium]